MLNLNSKFEITVSIGDANKAEIALKTYGLTAQEAEEVIQKESIVAIHDHGIVPQNAISPELIDIFGKEYINEIVEYVYSYMSQFKLDWDVIKVVITTLLKIYRPEDLITNPDLIRKFTLKVLLMVDNEDPDAEEDAINFSEDYDVLDSLSFIRKIDQLSEEDIITMLDGDDDTTEDYN